MGNKMVNEIQDSEVPHWDKTSQFCTELAKGYQKTKPWGFDEIQNDGIGLKMK